MPCRKYHFFHGISVENCTFIGCTFFKDLLWDHGFSMEKYVNKAFFNRKYFLLILTNLDQVPYFMTKNATIKYIFWTPLESGINLHWVRKKWNGSLWMLIFSWVSYLKLLFYQFKLKDHIPLTGIISYCPMNVQK